MRRRGTVPAVTAIAAMATVLLVVGSTQPAAASCMPRAGIAAAIEQSDIVVVGTVTATHSADRIATVAVDDVWKGDVGRTLEVAGGPATDNMATSVDRSYRVGVRYLLFAFAPRAHGSPGTFGARYEDNNCSDTRPWARSLARFRPVTAAVTRPPTSSPAPRPATKAQASSSPRSWGLAAGATVGVGVVAIAIAFAFAFALRRRRRLAPT